MNSPRDIVRGPWRPEVRDLIAWLGLGLTCFVLSEVSLITPIASQGTALFWLAAGFILGTLTRLPLRSWPGALAAVFAACMVSNRLNDISWQLSVAFALANVIEPACGAWIFRWFAARSNGALIRQAIGLLVGGMMACVIGASIGTGSLALAGMSADLGATFKLWYVTDLVGMIVVAPLVIAWWPGSEWAAPRRQRFYFVEVIGALAVLSLAGYFVFLGRPQSLGALASLFAQLALLLTFSLRLGPRGASLCSACLSSLAVFGTLQGTGPFGVLESDMMTRATELQIYLAATAFVALVPSLLLTERANMTATIAAREKEVGAIFQAIGEGLIVTDTTGNIRYDNAAARRLLRLDSGETTGRPFTEVVIVEGVEPGEDIASRVIRDAVVVRSSEPRKLLRLDETEVFTTLTGAPVLGTDGAVTGAVVILADDTTRRAHADRLAETERQLAHAQKLRAVGDLAAGVAHDFNNILTAIQGSAQILQFDARDDQKELLQDILDASNKAKQLTGQLSVFNRNDPVDISVLDASDVLRGMRSILTRLLGEDIVLQIEDPAEAFVVQADRTQLEQILVNLSINARDAMPSGGTLEIRLSATTRKGDDVPLPGDAATVAEYVVIEVKDSGQGMDESIRGKIFEPFFTTKASGAGTGLGLATVQMVCDRHQGFVEVESALGKGSSFRVFLPRIHETPHASSSSALLTQGGAGQKILVVEDSRELRAPIQRLLQRKGFESTIAEDAVQALRLIEASQFDLVLTDVVMPGVNGKELADRIEVIRPDLPVLFMSGYSDGVLGQRVDGLGGRRLLKKPFSADELTRAILKSLKGAPLSRRPKPSD